MQRSKERVGSKHTLLSNADVWCLTRVDVWRWCLSFNIQNRFPWLLCPYFHWDVVVCTLNMNLRVMYWQRLNNPALEEWILRPLSGRTLGIRWFKVRLQGAQLHTNMHLMVQHSFKRSRSGIIRWTWVLEHFFTPVRCPASILNWSHVKKLLMMSKLSPQTQILRLCPPDGARVLLVITKTFGKCGQIRGWLN